MSADYLDLTLRSASASLVTTSSLRSFASSSPPHTSSASGHLSDLDYENDYKKQRVVLRIIIKQKNKLLLNSDFKLDFGNTQKHLLVEDILEINSSDLKVCLVSLVEFVYVLFQFLSLSKPPFVH